MKLSSTFIHLDKIGYIKERQLWDAGILTWDEYFAQERNDLFFDKKHSMLAKSELALKEGNIDFFASAMKTADQYRLALTYPNDVMFLDIETTGLSRYYDFITVIGWSINGKYKYYVHGIDKLDSFVKDLLRAKVLVTFNGKIFDIPFIQSVFSTLKFPKCHVDLRFFAKKADLSGGQKQIETDIGVIRPKVLQDTGGFEATVLWDKYKWGSKPSLIKLIRYNHADIEGMKSIIDHVILHIYKKEDYSNYFPKPLLFEKSYKSRINISEIKQHIDSNEIPFDPKAALKFKQLFEKIERDNLKIVGIDLTGSEGKASGVAYLENEKVTTSLIFTNDEMIDFITKVNPHMVSIDSPLSLPFGRLTVFDDDPTRDEFGILRICERVLKKRGVNAYPTLLPSMQKLTKRGIELAERLRNIGIPVVESYPGVVQDIIGLPRKQASLSLLKKGLGKFGLRGAFLRKKVSHDEIDAITSAIVGLFFFSGDYEAIGSRDENLMVIPDLNTTPSDKYIIGYSSSKKEMGLSKAISHDPRNIIELDFDKLSEQIKSDSLKGKIFITKLEKVNNHAYLVEEFGFNYFHLEICNDMSVSLNIPYDLTVKSIKDLSGNNKLTSFIQGINSGN